MSTETKKGEKGQTGRNKGGRADAPLQLAAIGMEAEFQVSVDGELVRPEDVFGDPRSFVRGDLMHRTGTSYHLPTGSAVYFDTGVIEVATPVIEIEPGCAARAGRSLWESILFVRGELDAWEERTGREVRLIGFSTHYNVYFELPGRLRLAAMGLEAEFSLMLDDEPTRPEAVFLAPRTARTWSRIR